ncbi:MAG: PDZ domain-containing protein [Isosphaeraceae bacterium]|nr:PDZ domain-containing protein [Isosphaeraceae bacterium]
MISLMKSGGRVPLNVLALALGAWVLSGPAAVADGEQCVIESHGQKPVKRGLLDRCQQPSELGTRGYGPPGLFPGFQGFGLGYHLGYGYGGDALGPGADGGYPFYGGPGYPHCWPTLRRIGGITPFPYFGGPGYPTPSNPNYFGGVGPLVADTPVVTIGDDQYDTGYGGFTGAVPYPEEVLAPYTTRAGALGSAAGASLPNPSAPPANAESPVEGRSLGIDAEPFAAADGLRGMKVSKVYPGSVGEKAGLHTGDVIHSINGYVTEQPINLTWILAHAAADNVLKMSVRTASDGKVHTVTGKLP